MRVHPMNRTWHRFAALAVCLTAVACFLAALRTDFSPAVGAAHVARATDDAQPAADAPVAAPGSLAEAIAAVTDEERFRSAHWGLLIVDVASGEVLLEQNADKLFAPASTTKLFTVAAALAALGADHRYETALYQIGLPPADGRLEGHLVLLASGDPTLGGRTDEHGEIAYTNADHTYADGSERTELTAPDPLAGLNELARQVAAAGIRRIEGDVLVDDRLFDATESTGSGPRRVTPIVVNDNLLDIVVAPTEVGQPARIEWRPETSYYQLEADVTTGAADREAQVSLREIAPRRLRLEGSIPAGHEPLVHVHEVDDPAAFARALLIEALERADVRVAADPRSAAAAELPAPSAYGDLPRVGLLESPPFSESARLILKVSHNLHASTLPLVLAARGGGRTLAAGLRMQGEVLGTLDVDVPTISLGGGAGGSRADYTTPRATVALLRHMATRDDAAVFRRALPILGVDGTLSTAVAADSPARGHAQAKTGTFYWQNPLAGRYLLTSKALAGYLQTSNGRDVAFAFFVNLVPIDRPSERNELGRVLGHLCEIAHERL